MLGFRRTPRRRLTDERLAAVCLYSQRDRQVRAELQPNVPRAVVAAGAPITRRDNSK